MLQNQLKIQLKLLNGTIQESAEAVVYDLEVLVDFDLK